MQRILQPTAWIELHFSIIGKRLGWDLGPLHSLLDSKQPSSGGIRCQLSPQLLTGGDAEGKREHQSNQRVNVHSSGYRMPRNGTFESMALASETKFSCGHRATPTCAVCEHGILLFDGAVRFWNARGGIGISDTILTRITPTN